MSKMKIKKGDQVKVVSGKEAGKSGKVLRVETGDHRVVVERLNMMKKHTKPNPKKNPQGGVIEREAPWTSPTSCSSAPPAASRPVWATGCSRTAARSASVAARLRQRHRQGVTMARLKDRYFSEIVPELMEEFGYRNVMQVPRVTKVTLNMGVGEAKTNAKLLDDAVEELALIAGQRPAITKARKSIASFKLREGMSIGCRVTLRGERMYEMLDRLVSIALPRIRDFRGIDPGQFDGRGNFAMGVREQIIFPEIDYDKVEQFRGLDIVITTTAKTDDEGRALLSKLGMPFRAN